MFASTAYAANAAEAAPNALGPLVPLVVIFAIFYFLLIRPQQKKAKEHTKFLESMKQGDSVVTAGGLYGKVVKIEDHKVLIEIADKVKVHVIKSQLYLNAQDINQQK